MFLRIYIRDFLSVCDALQKMGVNRIMFLEIWVMETVDDKYTWTMDSKIVSNRLYPTSLYLT